MSSAWIKKRKEAPAETEDETRVAKKTKEEKRPTDLDSNKILTVTKGRAIHLERDIASLKTHELELIGLMRRTAKEDFPFMTPDYWIQLLQKIVPGPFDPCKCMGNSWGGSMERVRRNKKNAIISGRPTIRIDGSSLSVRAWMFRAFVDRRFEFSDQVAFDMLGTKNVCRVFSTCAFYKCVSPACSLQKVHAGKDKRTPEAPDSLHVGRWRDWLRKPTRILPFETRVGVAHKLSMSEIRKIISQLFFEHQPGECTSSAWVGARHESPFVQFHLRGTWYSVVWLLVGRKVTLPQSQTDEGRLIHRSKCKFMRCINPDCYMSFAKESQTESKEASLSVRALESMMYTSSDFSWAISNPWPSGHSLVLARYFGMVQAQILNSTKPRLDVLICSRPSATTKWIGTTKNGIPMMWLQLTSKKLLFTARTVMFSMFVPAVYKCKVLNDSRLVSLCGDQDCCVPTCLICLPPFPRDLTSSVIDDYVTRLRSYLITTNAYDSAMHKDAFLRTFARRVHAEWTPGTCDKNADWNGCAHQVFSVISFDLDELDQPVWIYVADWLDGRVKRVYVASNESATRERWALWDQIAKDQGVQQKPQCGNWRCVNPICHFGNRNMDTTSS